MRSDPLRTLVRVSELKPALRRLFGFEDFRPGQERVVRAAVEGRDTLALMPTGSGKSLTYQLAAMLRPTPTLVLSPLIALMKDQLDKLPPEVAEQSTLINSSLGQDEAARRVRDASQGRYKLLYVAPERLRQRSFLEAIVGIDIGLVVIDEVHCVSMWGHDFRPDYLFIRRALDELGAPAILGMTATATPATEREIAAALGRELREPGAHAARPRPRRRPLPRRPGGGGAGRDAGGVHRGPRPDGRRDDRVRDGDRQAGHPPRRALQLPGVARELRPDGRPRRAGRPRLRHAPARKPLRCDPAAQVRPLGHPHRRRPPFGLRAPPWRRRGAARGSRRRARPARARRDARAGRSREARLRRRPRDADRGSRAAGGRGRTDRLSPRPLRARGARPGGASRPLRRVARLPAPAGGGALRRDVGERLRYVRRLLAARGRSRRDRTGGGAASRRHRGRHPQRRSRPALAARPHRTRRDAPRLDERATLRPAVTSLRATRRGPPGRCQTLDPAARDRWGTRVVRERGRL